MNHIDFLNKEASEGIKTRGYSSSAQIPSDLANPKWFLAVNDIAYSYCPTNRYLYLRKVEDKRPKQTWESYKGKILDELIPEIYKRVHEYSTATALRNLNINEDVRKLLNEIVESYKSNLKPDQLLVVPSETDVDQFFNDLIRLSTYEIGIASSFLNFRVSNLYDINVASEFNVLFPFDFKLKISAPSLGIAGSAEVDFLIRKSIVGEIKSTEWFEFYNIGLAGYALALEADRKMDINLGAVLCPIFTRERTVPIFHSNSNIKIISESWRTMFLLNRNSRIEIVKNGKDPGRPKTNAKCNGCGFQQVCW